MPNSDGNGTLGKLAGLAGALLAIIIAIAALVGPVSRDLGDHEKLPAHPQAQEWRESEREDYREQKGQLDKIQEDVGDIKTAVTRLETLVERAVSR